MANEVGSNCELPHRSQVASSDRSFSTSVLNDHVWKSQTKSGPPKVNRRSLPNWGVFFFEQLREVGGTVFRPADPLTVPLHPEGPGE